MLDRKTAPSFEEVKSISLQEAKHHKLDNDVSLFVINTESAQPVIRVEFIHKAGKWFETKPGVSYFTAKMLAEGTDTLNSAEIANEIDKYGAFLDFEAGNDLITVTLYTLTKHLEKLLSLVSQLLNDSVFPENELEIKKKISIQEIRLSREKSSSVASSLFRKGLFGENHPYGQRLEEEAVEKITREDLLAFSKSQIQSNQEIIISGDIQESSIALLNNFFGKDKKSVPDVSERTVEIDLKDVWITKNESLQSSLRIGMRSIGMGHKDYNKLLITNEIFGGYFGSRLMKNIREDKGYTYGIHSGLGSLIHDSYFVITADVKKEHAQDTIDEIQKEIDLMKQKLVSNEELDTVKNYMRGTFISDIDTPFKLADKFKSVYLKGLGISYYESYFEAINSITAKEVRDMARKYFLTESFVKIVVG